MTRPTTRKGRVPRIAAALANGLPTRWREVAKASAVRPFADLQRAAVAAIVAAARIVSRWHSHTLGQPS